MAVTRPAVAGLLLAAGAGRRFGGPKALADTGGGPWVLRALATIDFLTPCVVVIGAEATRVRGLLPSRAGLRAVENPDFASGMGSSLVAGLQALDSVDAVAVMLVDLPDVPIAAVRRVVEVAIAAGDDLRDGLFRASYGGVPGHPVVIGAHHFAGVRAAAVADRGARDYLAARRVQLVECGDLASGADQDTSPAHHG